MAKIKEVFGADSERDAQELLDIRIAFNGGSGEVFRRNGVWAYRWYPPGVTNAAPALNQALTAPPPMMSGKPEVQKSPEINSLLDFIARFESGGNYNAIYKAGDNTDNPRLVDMTLAQVRSFQDRYVADGNASSAAGRYQIIRTTLDGLIASTGVAPTEKFSPEVQDDMARKLLEGRGLSRYLAGGLDVAEFAKNLAKEWAALPVIEDTTGHLNRRIKAGQSYYAGDGLNRAHASVTDFRNVLENLRA